MKIKEKEVIVLVHGLWMKGPEMLYLRYKFWRQGYRVYQFHYSSLLKTPAENAAKLYRFISKIDAPAIHFVAHSLGGIVLTHLFYNYTVNKKGKVAMIATPLKGSAVAVYLSQKKYFRHLLGKSIIKGLLGDGPDWSDKRKICIVAGTRGIGVGWLFAREVMQEPNDGTVNLHETRLEQADESHEIPRSHFLLLISNKAVKVILKFLSK